ncbi:MAG: hypothetical protein DMD79_25700 [Candidatus Rokuibacteriota bacterium]|nr:MAG: hypothetical protein DMD79_25700 [Candidatus Rokubacteria bacterium]
MTRARSAGLYPPQEPDARLRRRDRPLSEYAVIQTQFRDPAGLAAALTDLGFPASAIEWHEEPARLRGPSIEVPGYAHLVIRGRHVGPGANDLGFARGPDGVFQALVGVMEQRTCGWHGPYDQTWLGRLAAAYAVRQLAAQYQAKGWRVTITRQADGVVELVADG